jgi:cell volume regulation protein A
LLTELVIPDNSLIAGKQIVQLGLPKTTLISFIMRGDSYIIPDGSTIIKKNDKLFILSENKDALNSVFECLKMDNSGTEALI